MKSDDNRRFQYATTIALEYKETGKNPQRIIKLYSFKNKWN